MKGKIFSMLAVLSALTACNTQNASTQADKFDYTVEQFADLQILRYRVPEFDSLSLEQKKLVYYLTEAALQGRDILFDQNGKYNLTIRRTLEAVYTGYKGDRNTAYTTITDAKNSFQDSARISSAKPFLTPTRQNSHYPKDRQQNSSVRKYSP